MSTFSDIDGDGCGYIEAHQAHDCQPPRAATPLFGGGRAGLQEVAGRFAPPPRYLSACAFGLRVVGLRGSGLSDGRRGRPTLSPTPLRLRAARGGATGLRA